MDNCHCEAPKGFGAEAIQLIESRFNKLDIQKYLLSTEMANGWILSGYRPQNDIKPCQIILVPYIFTLPPQGYAVLQGVTDT